MMWLAAHYLGLVPLAAVLLTCPAPRRRYWLVAVGFAMSWVGDTLMMESGGSWRFSYAWLPGQVGLVLLGLAPAQATHMLAVALGISALALASYQWTSPAPDILVTLLGSALILRAATPDLAVTLYVYFGLGSVAYFLMAARAGSWSIMPFWVAYQVLRLAGVAAFTVAAWQRRARWAT